MICAPHPSIPLFDFHILDKHPTSKPTTRQSAWARLPRQHSPGELLTNPTGSQHHRPSENPRRHATQTRESFAYSCEHHEVAPNMSGSSTALALNKQRTPLKQISGSNTPVTESPGSWQHPRIDEITRRQNATVFTSDNVKTIVYNVGALVIISFIQRINTDFGPKSLYVLLT